MRRRIEIIRSGILDEFTDLPVGDTYVGTTLLKEKVKK